MDTDNLFKDFVCNALLQYIKSKYLKSDYSDFSNNSDFRQCIYIMRVFGFHNIAMSVERYTDPHPLNEIDI